MKSDLEKYLEQISNLDQKLNEFKNEKSPYVEKLKAARKIHTIKL